MVSCPACGHSNPEDLSRCIRCDAVLRGVGRALATVDSLAPVRVSPEMEALGEADTADALPVASAPDVSSRTMLGLPSPLAEPQTQRDLPDAALVAAAVAAHQAQQDAAADEMSRTVFGMPSPLAGLDPEASKNTVFGLPSPLAGTPSPSPGPAQSHSPDPSPSLEADDPSRRTVFGMPSPLAAGASSSAPPRDVETGESGEAPASAPEPAPAPRPAPAGAPRDALPRTRPMSLADLQAKSTAPPTKQPSPEPARPASPEKTPRRRSTGDAGRDREAAELYAAARFAAAIAEDDNLYAKARHRKTLLALLLVSIAAAVAAVFAFQEKSKLKAELTGEPTVSRSADRFGVVAGIRTSERATVTYPGGQASGEGEWSVEFSVPESEMSVGANTINLEAVPDRGGDLVRIPVRIVLYYRFKVPQAAPPKAGKPVRAYVEVGEGWTVSVDGGEASSAPGGRVELLIDPAPVLQPDSDGELPIRLSLTSPEGDTKRFAETIRVPIPKAPLNLWSPPHHWRRAAETVPVRGRTLPGAEVRVGDARATVGADGLFDLSVPVVMGDNDINVQVRAPGRQSVDQKLSVQRITAWTVRAETKKLKRMTRVFLKGASRTPTYERMLGEPEAVRGAKARIKGRLVEVRRGASGVDELHVATCIGSGGCPVWVHLDGPVFAGQGDAVTVVGTLAGLHTFRRGGTTLEAPRVDASILIP